MAIENNLEGNLNGNACPYPLVKNSRIKLQADVIYRQAEALEQAKIADSLMEDLVAARAEIEKVCRRVGIDINQGKRGSPQ